MKTDKMSVGQRIVFQSIAKQVRNWIKDEGSILQMKGRSKAKRYRKEKYPLMEKKLHEEFLEKSTKGNSIKRWWFTFRGCAILGELYPGEEFTFSDHWFRRFSTRKGILLRRKTHKSQKDPADLKLSITQFHAKLLRERRRGTYQLQDLGNMDQTPLPFVMDDNKTYESKGAEEVWCVTGASGFNERQCTAQLTIFADGSVLPPLQSFQGQGKRIKTE